jgi:ferredoxin
MRVAVDFALCESNAICAGVAPEVFELGDDDVLRLLDDQPDESLGARLREAARRCPKQAISIEED